MLRGAALAACIALAIGATDAHAQVQPKIVGGSTTTIAQYPWQAAVVYDPTKLGGNPFQRQFCGGSLVTSRIVLTAGHCVHRTDPDNNSDLDADDVNVVLGQTTLSTAPSSSEFDVQGVAKQAGYAESGGVPSNDVGYLVLQSPYSATTPIDIAGPDEGALWDPGSPEQITGWGATAESGPGSGGSDTLRHATVPIVSDSSCALDYGGSFNASTMVCAGFPEGGIDTCFGDSGGPMQAAIGGGAYRLVGITSWGVGCAQASAPGVYTRVAGGGLRSAIASTVFELETTFGLPHEDIIGGNEDTDPPETSITSGPAGPTNDSTPTFGFASDEASVTFQCRFDSAGFAACSGPGATHTPAAALGDGAHTFEVRAIDPSNNADPTPASRSFTITIQAPIPPSATLSAAVDRTPPVGRLSARLKRGGVVVVELGSNEECVANAGGVVVANRSRFALASISAHVPGGGSVRLKLSPKGKTARALIRRLLAKHGPAKAKIKATFTDAGGNATAEKRVVKLSRR